MDRPNNVHPDRWHAMLKWWDTRASRNDGVDFTTQERDELLDEIAFARKRDAARYTYWDDKELEPMTSYPV